MKDEGVLSIKNGFRFGIAIMALNLCYNVFVPKEYYDLDSFMKYMTIIRVFCVIWIYRISKDYQFNIGLNCVVGFFFPGLTLVVLYYKDKRDKEEANIPKREAELNYHEEDVIVAQKDNFKSEYGSFDWPKVFKKKK